LKEEWKPVSVPGYENAYEVSNLGRIKSKERKAKFKTQIGTIAYRRVEERVFTPQKTTIYPPSVNIGNTRYLVHTLVARAFLGAGRGDQIVHIDGDYCNNRVDNLRFRHKGHPKNSTT